MELSLFHAKILIQVSANSVFTDYRDITFLPSVFIEKNELFFGQYGGQDKLTIVGLPVVLSQIEVNISCIILLVYKINIIFYNSLG